MIRESSKESELQGFGIRTARLASMIFSEKSATLRDHAPSNSGFADAAQIDMIGDRR
jgi:hypothetical protein